MKDALGYLRVSSDEQADSGLGIEAERQRIADYCQLKGLHLAQVYEDLAISGGKPLASRPAGSQLLAEAKETKALVIVAKLDRLFRSVADAATVIADFDRKGIELYLEHDVEKPTCFAFQRPPLSQTPIAASKKGKTGQAHGVRSDLQFARPYARGSLPGSAGAFWRATAGSRSRLGANQVTARQGTARPPGFLTVGAVTHRASGDFLSTEAPHRRQNASIVSGRSGSQGR